MNIFKQIWLVFLACAFFQEAFFSEGTEIHLDVSLSDIQIMDIEGMRSESSDDDSKCPICLNKIGLAEKNVHVGEGCEHWVCSACCKRLLETKIAQLDGFIPHEITVACPLCRNDRFIVMYKEDVVFDGERGGVSIDDSDESATGSRLRRFFKKIFCCSQRGVQRDTCCRIWDVENFPCTRSCGRHVACFTTSIVVMLLLVRLWAEGTTKICGHKNDICIAQVWTNNSWPRTGCEDWWFFTPQCEHNITACCGVDTCAVVSSIQDCADLLKKMV